MVIIRLRLPQRSRWWAVAAVAALSVAAGCGQGEPSQGPLDPATGYPLAATAPLAAFEPVAGSCTTFIYSPPGADSTAEGDLCIPTASVQPAAIVLVHGGGGTGGSRRDLDVWVRWYQTRGHVTFNIDYETLQPEPERSLFPEPEQQTMAAVQFVRANADRIGVDPAAIVVHGTSAGARLGGISYTADGLDRYDGQNRWRNIPAGVDGFVGFSGYYDGWTFRSESYFGEGVPPEAIALDNADRARGPALLVHGLADSIVGAESTIDFGDALDRAGIDVELVLVEGAGHGFDGYGTDQLTDRGREVAADLDQWLTRHF